MGCKVDLPRSGAPWETFSTSKWSTTLSQWPNFYAASANPWTETTYDNVPHYLIGQSVSDSGRLGQKWWEIDCVPSLLLFLVTTAYRYDFYIYFDCVLN